MSRSIAFMLVSIGNFVAAIVAATSHSPHAANWPWFIVASVAFAAMAIFVNDKTNGKK